LDVSDRSIGNWQSTIGNAFAPTRYREVVLLFAT
jgi:hypothetical protein